MIDINKMAEQLVAAYVPMRKNDTDERNKSWYDMVTTYAPNLAKNCKNFVSSKYDVPVSQLKAVETHYLMFRDELKNSNKFHYYAIYELPEERYVSVNCSGRIGFIERTYDLTDKALKRAATSLAEAKKAMDSHRRTKYNKGYVDVKLRQGSVKVAYDLYDLTEDISDAYETLKKLNMSHKKLMHNSTARKFDEALEALEDVMSDISLN